MTPENDKTLKGIFHSDKHTIGTNEWNDRRDYRIKYEKVYNIGNRDARSLNITIGLFHELKEIPILRDDDRADQNEEDYIMRLGKFFPESKLFRKMRWIWSFGMCADIEGNFTDCDCCGSRLHALNTSGYGMCDLCEVENKYNDKDFNIL
jgi:hypothetical protein